MANRKMPKADRACKICGTTPITGYKYCDGCKREAKNRRQRTYDVHPWFGTAPYALSKVRRANKIARHIRCCETCGTFFDPPVPSQRQLRGESDWGRFCLVSCSVRTGAPERRRIVWLLSRRAKCKVCGSVFLSRYGQPFCSHECAAYRPAKSSRNCQECGTHFTPAYGDKRRSFCGKPCLKRHYRRVRRHRERARERAAKVEPVNPRKVFDRDGYRCQLCGHKTLKTKRGSYHPKAPELDHIVPLACGGEHSYRNTQCACRACNMAKSDGAGGQLLLIGEHA